MQRSACSLRQEGTHRIYSDKKDKTLKYKDKDREMYDLISQELSDSESFLPELFYVFEQTVDCAEKKVPTLPVLFIFFLSFVRYNASTWNIRTAETYKTLFRL